MRWPWRQKTKPIEPRRMVSTRIMELETAKEILAEVFHARPSEVEEMNTKEAGGEGWDGRYGKLAGNHLAALRVWSYSSLYKCCNK
jgi:hypothetical protein